MAEVKLLWVPAAAPAGLNPAAVAKAAGVPLHIKGPLQAAVVAAPAGRATKSALGKVGGRPAIFLDLAGEVGGGPTPHRSRRAAAAVARAAGSLAAGLNLPPPSPAVPVERAVLVYGAGLSALAAAGQAASLGHEVLWASPEASRRAAGDDDQPALVSRLSRSLPAGVEVALKTELVHLCGAAGAFEARLQGPRGDRQQSFGAVILAPAGRWQPADGLEGVLAEPLSQIDPEQISGPAEGWCQAAVLAGAGRPLSAQAFARALAYAGQLQGRPRVQASLFFQEARVAAPGGERLYRQVREAGVLPVRVEPGGLAASSGVLSWPDPILDQELELAPDLVVCAEEIGATAPEFLSNEILWPPWERLLPEHPRLDGGKSAISGLYILGALRGTPSQERPAEAAAAAADLTARLAGLTPPLPEVRHDYCASCLTCVRVCPHGVPRYAHDRILPAPAACLACGICAAECPAEAIAPAGGGNAEVQGGLAAGLAKTASPALVLFACRQSAGGALAELSRQGHQLPAELLVMPVNCAGRVGEQLIYRALALGAAGVLVAGCHQGNCRSLGGNLRARLRSKAAADFLAAARLPGRVAFVHLASNQPRELARALDEMRAGLEEGHAP